MHPLRALPVLASFVFLAYFAVSSSVRGDSTIDTTNRFGYGANVGWTNWRWDTGSPGDGATVGLNFCSGFIYGANIGWIHLGNGAPADGIAYANASGDFGVNVAGIDLSATPPEAQLQGLAYGANIGWINFDNTWNDSPRLDLETGRLKGFAYSANCGWIDLGSNGVIFVQTTRLEQGPDTDGDRIPDWWELAKVLAAGLGTGTQAGDLALLGKTTDSDHDTLTDLGEFNADTDPFDNTDFLRIVSFPPLIADPANASIEWTSKLTRIYALEGGPGMVFSPLVTGIAPGAGATTSVVFDASPFSFDQFWRISARPPLAP